MPSKPLSLLLDLEFPVTAALVAASMLDARFLSPACIVMLLFWPLRRAVDGRWTVRTPVDLPILVLLASLAVSTSISVDPAVSIPQALRLLSGIGLFYAVVNWASSGARLRLLAWGYSLAGAGLAGLAFFTVDWSEAKLPFIPPEAYSLFSLRVQDSIHPNVLAGSLLLFAAFALAQVLWSPGGLFSGRLVPGALFAFMAAILLLSQSRSALLALLFAALLLFALRWRWGWIGFLASGAAGAWLLTMYGPANISDLLFGSRVLGGLQGRLEIWSRAIFILQDFPLTGVGMGLYPLATQTLYPFFTEGAAIPHAHNLFLQVGVDLGIPGLAAWLAAYLGLALAAGSVFRRAVRARVVLNGAWPAVLGAGGLALQAAVGLHGLFDATLWGGIRAAPLLWAAWAGIASAWNAARVPADERA